LADIVAPAVDVVGFCCSYDVNRGSVRRPSLCDSNVCGMSEIRIVAAVSRAVTASCSDGLLGPQLATAVRMLEYDLCRMRCRHYRPHLAQCA
jgi:hypothetical protein